LPLHVNADELEKPSKTEVARLDVSDFDFVLSMLEQTKEQVKQLSLADQQALRDWLDEILEDELEFTDAFQANIEKAKCDIEEGRGVTR
jgi:protein-tyrosine-phosphatase